jgi:hypothetical protein
MPKSLGILNKATFKNFKEVFSSPTISGGTLTLDISNGNVFNVALNANISPMVISTPPNSSLVGNFILIFTADGTGRSVTWASSIKWYNLTPPTLTTTNGKRDIFTFVTYDGGTNWYGGIGGQNL